MKKPKRAAETEAKNSVRLVQELFSGPIDIIGDVHGEYGALLSLLDRLGYDAHGNHPENRRLVFVGDLVDRGPDSISVVNLVKTFCERNKAQCILGNHEFNLLRGQKKHGNHWFYGETESICKGSDAISFQKLADDSTRKEILDFFYTLPVALEGKDVRVVHAAWKDEMIDLVRGFKGTVVELHDLYKKKLVHKIKKEEITDKEEIDLIHQNENPVKVCTSGLEKRVKEKFFAGGKYRTVDRHEWWDEETSANSNTLTVIGHYWRRNMERVSDKLYDIHPNGFEPTGRDLFKEYDAFSLLGPAKSIMCVDYAAGIRYEERGMGLPEGSIGTNMGALRLPERFIILDDGTDAKCT
eukprot:CAMPEP_0204837936 /NCGR_PEP_ID=MMETSP1346-20131115/29332_1 /ASSEMBLY_ACC=CAM_ASM_000771 /TAXON_ID=215587 /ORGANISM="Aplanochytrium stocchinoi, Strain GSBS06" /LENGTH=353 /DNA_ID=CAMNT_0051973669 /DNA_START=67 /DNA_END=1128 /DNA_ORIENTATION=-